MSQDYFSFNIKTVFQKMAPYTLFISNNSATFMTQLSVGSALCLFCEPSLSKLNCNNMRSPVIGNFSVSFITLPSLGLCCVSFVSQVVQNKMQQSGKQSLKSVETEIIPRSLNHIIAL